MEKIPVHIISGFLGSGKTTTIIRLLQKNETGEKWAVLINEFGKISIDGQTIQSNSGENKVFEVSGGCICCSAQAYFKESLNIILKEGNYSRIVIEPSGLGGIEMVSSLIGSISQLELMPVICLVDLIALSIPKLQLNLIYQMQIKNSSVIWFTKEDLLPDELERDRLIDQFISQYPGKTYLLAKSIPIEPFLRGNSSGTVDKGYFRPASWFGDLSDRNYNEHQFTFEPEIRFNQETFLNLFKQNPVIFRAKGFIHTQTGWKLFNLTVSDTNFEDCTEQPKSEIIVITERSESFPFGVFAEEIRKSV